MTESSGADVLVRIVHGAPDDAELAALTAVVAGLSSTAGRTGPSTGPRSRWGDPASRLRLPASPSHGGWRASGYPA